MTYIQNAYYNWKNSPVVQGLKNTLTKVEQIPFPAVTECEKILLNEEHDKSFEVLKMSVSLENEITWICSEEELNMFRLSLDIEWP